MSANGAASVRRCWSSSTTVEGIEIDGVDIIAWNEAGRIVDSR